MLSLPAKILPQARRAWLAGLATSGLLVGVACSASRPAGEVVKSNGAPSGSTLPRTSLPMPPLTAPGHGPAATTRRSTATSFTLLDERRSSLADYRGRVVVLDFYATWCLPCRQQVPHLISLQQRFGAEGLRVIGLNAGGEEDRAAVPGFIREFGIQYELGYPSPEMSDLFFSDDTTIPQTYVFDRRGNLVKRFIGYSERMPAVLEEIVRASLEIPAAD